MIRNGHAGFGRGVSEKDHKAPRRGPTSADPTGEKAKTVKAPLPGVHAAAAVRQPRRATARTTPTSTARPATPEQSQPNGQPSECATQCAPGNTATAACPPHTTGRAPTLAAAARKRSSDSTPAIGHPPASSPTYSGPGKPRARPPAPTHEPGRTITRGNNHLLDLRGRTPRSNFAHIRPA